MQINVLGTGSSYFEINFQGTHNKGAAIWEVEYNFTQYYGLTDISANSLHNLVESFTTEESDLFAK